MLSVTPRVCIIHIFTRKYHFWDLNHLYWTCQRIPYQIWFASHILLTSILHASNWNGFLLPIAFFTICVVQNLGLPGKLLGILFWSCCCPLFMWGSNCTRGCMRYHWTYSGFSSPCVETFRIFGCYNSTTFLGLWWGSKNIGDCSFQGQKKVKLFIKVKVSLKYRKVK